ncbi:unnamed protein product, partial [Mesorhabditis belari]|uniref:C2H2-type domain-containing protein n=1 Tax=Mesorhabditis belari TaxID=2138241 RepID=A0AAF3J1M0_9BILA
MSATVKVEAIDDEELDMSLFTHQIDGMGEMKEESDPYPGLSIGKPRVAQFTKRIEAQANRETFRICVLCTKNVIMVSKGYIQAGLLVSHAISHIDVRPYGCNLCDYSARFEINVRKHILKEHSTSENGDSPTLSKLHLKKKPSNEMPKIVDNMDRKALDEFRDATLLCFPTERTSILEWYTRKAIRYDRGDRKCRNTNVNGIQGKIVEKILLKKKLDGPSARIQKPNSLRSDPISFTSPAQRNVTNDIEKLCQKTTFNGEIKTEIDDEAQQSTSQNFQQDEIDISLLFSKGASPKIQSNPPRIAWKKSNLGSSHTKSISKSPVSASKIKEELPEPRSTHQQVLKRSPITIYPANSLAMKNEEVTLLRSQLREKELALRKVEAHLVNKITSINQLQKTNEQLQARLKEMQRENGNGTENTRLIQALKGKDQRIQELEEEIIMHKDHKQKLHELLEKQSHNQNKSTPTDQ